MKAMRIIFIFSVTCCMGFLFFYILGNPFDAILTGKAAVRQNRALYSGKMKISGVVFDRNRRLYIASFDDGNGVVSEFVYNPKENTFTDNYRYYQISVVKHTIKGKVIKKITASGVYPEEVYIEFDCKAGIIGEETQINLYKVYVVLENTDKEEFIDNVMLTVKALEDTGFLKYEIMNGSFIASFSKGSISNNRYDIAARVKTTEN